MLEPSHNDEAATDSRQALLHHRRSQRLVRGQAPRAALLGAGVPWLNPVKRRGNRRYYQRQDVLMIRQIRALLYDQGFTIGGARQRLSGDEAKDDVTQYKQAHPPDDRRAGGSPAGPEEVTEAKKLPLIRSLVYSAAHFGSTVTELGSTVGA